MIAIGPRDLLDCQRIMYLVSGKGQSNRSTCEEKTELMTDVKFVMKDGAVYKNEFALEAK